MRNQGAKSLMDPGFEYKGHLHTNIAETFERARREIDRVKVVKLPPLGKSNDDSHMRKEGANEQRT